MKKILLIMALIICFSGISNAQRKSFHINTGAEVIFPIGDWEGLFHTGYGGSMQVEMGLSDQVLGVFLFGYSQFGADDYIDPDNGENVESEMSSIPMLVGFKYFIAKNIGIYAQALVGGYFSTVKIDGGYYPGEYSDQQFATRFGVGYELPLGEDVKIDLSAHYAPIYEMANAFGRLGIKVRL